MIRTLLVALLALLAACAQQGTLLVPPEGPQLATGAPGLNVARAAMTGGSPDIALTITNALLAKDPGDEASLLVQGDALGVLGRLDEADASYAKALALNPDSVGAKVGLGRLRLRSDPKQAQLLFLEVLQREPRNIVALTDLGIAHDLLGDHASAQASYRQALGIDPTLRSAEVNLALSMALSGQLPDSIRMLRALANDPDASRRTRHDLAVALALGGDKAGAARILAADMTPDEIDRALAAYGGLAP